MKDLHRALSPFSSSISVMDDDWAKLKRLQIKTNIDSKKLRKISKIIKKNPGVNTVIFFQDELFDKKINSLSDLVNLIISFLESNNAENSVHLHFKSFGRIPLHKRAILSRLKKKGVVNDPKNGFPVYIEMKTSSEREKDSRTFILRLGERLENLKSHYVSILEKKPILVLYSPFTVQEISDFFRLSLTFKTQVILTNENNEAEKLIEKTKKSLFKGIDKIKFSIIESLSELMKQRKNGIFIGFSLWGASSIIDLPKELSLRSKITKQIFLVFGNEEQGLPMFIRDLIPMFHIGTHASEPLRASQAAAFAFGILKV